MSATPSDCAHELLELAPPLMQFIRQGMRGGRDSSLTVAQFRTLIAIEHIPGCSLSDAAAHVGLGAPAMSVLVEALVQRRLLTRSNCPEDRRRSELALTPEGRAVLQRARKTTHAVLARRLTGLDPDALLAVATAIKLLNGTFAAERPALAISESGKP